MLLLVFILNNVIHCIGDYFIKRASIAFTWRDVIFGSIFYLITVPGWVWLLKFAKLATLASLGAALNIMMLVAMGVFIFHEHLSTREVVGVLLAIAAVVMFYR